MAKRSFSAAAREIDRKGTRGEFTRFAKSHGKSVGEMVKTVLAEGSTYSTKRKRQAAFAKAARKIARD